MTHNLAIDASVIVAVGGVGFRYYRLPGGDFTGGEAFTVGKGTDIDEPWLTAARTVAASCLSNALAELRGEDPIEPETIQCPECGRLLCAVQLAHFSGKRKVIDCGPDHVIKADGMVSLTMHADGSASWFAPMTGRP